LRIVLLVSLGCALIAAAGYGAVQVSWATVMGTIAERIGLSVPWQVDRTAGPLLWSIRFPRVLFGALVGATLATAGGALQGLFRNPLADPGVIGVSAGAALATASAIVLGGQVLDADAAARWVPWLMPIAAFGGAMLAAAVVLSVSRKGAPQSVATMLLAGIAINALASAGTGLLTSLATDAQLRALSFWTLGSLGGATWRVVCIAALPMVIALIGLQRLAPVLDLLLLGEREAAHLGVRTTRLRVTVIVCVALGVGSAVAFSGLIGFVGLVIPHLVRLVVGPSHRGVLPLGAILGATLLVLTDLGSRTVLAPVELPIGAVTAAFGAPVFLWLVLRRRTGGIA
jgi:iron complex transport system permease protein